MLEKIYNLVVFTIFSFIGMFLFSALQIPLASLCWPIGLLSLFAIIICALMISLYVNISIEELK